MASSKRAATKGNRVELNTFLKYGKADVIGYKTENYNGKTYVNFIWCKICARNKNEILGSSTLRGPTKKSAMSFIDGTNEASG